MNAHQKLSEAPLSPAQLQRITSEMVREARRVLVARRFINVFGPIGAGVESISFDTYGRLEAAEIHLEGRVDPKPIGWHTAEEYRRIPLLYKDFMFHWRDIKQSQDMNSPIDAGNALLAAHSVAMREDDLVFNGSEDLGIAGLTSAKGTRRIKGRSWKKPGNAFEDIFGAIQALQGEGHHPPYALALSVDTYSRLLRGGDEPVLELDQAARLCTDGVFQTDVLAERTGVLVSTGDHNLDIAVAEDLALAYLGPRDMNHSFRVYESLVLRIKRPTAVCVLTVGE